MVVDLGKVAQTAKRNPTAGCGGQSIAEVVMGDGKGRLPADRLLKAGHGLGQVPLGSQGVAEVVVRLGPTRP